MGLLTILAGKSTTISMLRGEIRPSGKRGELYIQDVSVAIDRYKARFHLGVCPQFDAIDTMSVREHLSFYAKVRGVENVPETVEAMIRSVGLQPFADRMAEKLSGGNKRKLSLAMALIGNPEVVLLDEPSSGMDPVAKRNMWRTLQKFRPGRSILLTTHSMEEADALASRVGVIARRLLDIGTTSHLRTKHGHGFHVHVVMKSAPHTTEEEITKLQRWVDQCMEGAEREGIPYHGQVRYHVPITPPTPKPESLTNGDEISSSTAVTDDSRTVASLFTLLEENKETLGIEFYSVSPSTFDEVFLSVIEKNNVGEEDNHERKSQWPSFFNLRRRPFPLGV
jgi:ATP-binding cassette, subfamily A (ABC1), member 3